ncbi:MAG: hypothetical protein K5985_06215 [Lachnospiraceae bacterium]|nr:hypothetical protein [Lachnospiraceae bacterium]
MNNIWKILAVTLIVSLLSGCGRSKDNEFSFPEEVPEPAMKQEEKKPVIIEPEEEPAEEPVRPEEPASEEPEADAGEGTALSTAVNHFNWRLFETQTPEGNLFYSPFSIEAALGMAALGAGEDTRAELTRALGIDDYDAFCREMSAFTAYPSSEKAKLTTANSLWIADSLPMSPEFEKSVKPDAEKIYNAEVFSVDFAGNLEKTKEKISGWVKEKTGGLIPDYEPVASQETVMDLINAVYFYGEWQKKFVEEETYSETFHGKHGDRDVDFMHLSDEYYKLVTRDGITALSIPYENPDLVMDILIPENKEGEKDITALFTTLDEEGKDAFFEALDDANEQELKELAVPKYTMDITFNNLKGALEKLGMKEVFVSSGSKFPGFAENLYLSDIAHRAKVEVDEKGSRAAAVTEETMGVTAVMPETEAIRFRADVPFIFTIRNRADNVILFTGRVNEL